MSNKLDRLKNYIEFQIQQNHEDMSDLDKSGEPKGSKLFSQYQEKIIDLKSELESVEDKLALSA